MANKVVIETQLRTDALKKQIKSIEKDLKGLETKKMLRSCSGCIEDAVRIAQKVVFGQED